MCLGLCLLLFVTGCASTRIQDQVTQRLALQDYKGAVELIDKEQGQYAGANSLLYFMDRGGLEQRVGLYKESNSTLEQAEFLMDELYTKSVSEGVASFLVNDMTMAYSGEDFEQVAVNILKTLNYLYLGDLTGAQVEARKVNNHLLALSDKYGKETIYKEDAFARYLSGFSYESAGEYNDAYLDYKYAYHAYEWYKQHFGIEIPMCLKNDLLRLSQWLRFDEEYQHWRELFGEGVEVPGSKSEKRTEVLLVVYDGIMPAKQTRFSEAPVLDENDHPYILKVAFPVIRAHHPAIGNVRCQNKNGDISEGVVVQPFQEIAIQNLNQRIGGITAKAIARAVAKYIAAVQARRAARSQGEGAALLVALATNVYSVVSEQADTRSWRTLPNRFWIMRMPLTPGRHELTVQITGLHGEARPNETVTVELKKGEKKVLPIYVPR